jgi:predicted TIM-barrel fold metal-dependent hydrolase
MPSFPIIDAHVHLWDPGRLSYKWQRGRAPLDRAYRIEDYKRDCAGIEVAALVFVECLVDPGLFEAEVRFIEEQAVNDSRIKAIVAQAPLEVGRAVLPFLEQLKATTPLLRGIRRIVEHEAALDFCLNPAFVEGVKLLAPLGLSFEMTVNYRHMDSVVRFADQVSEVPWILDHCGKPAIREGRLEPWRAQLRSLASHPNVMCKLSGLLVEAEHHRWKPAQLEPYVEAAVKAFGFDRVVYGGDWPVCLQAGTLSDWIGVLDRCFAGVALLDLKRLYRDNANDFYRLNLSPVS